MKTYTVHEAPDAYGDRLERAERLVFVREGFSWTAALLTPFWMLAHGLWLALIAYVAGVTVLQLTVSAMGMPEQAIAWLMLGLHVLVGYEADAIRRWTLGRRGYATVGTVSGTTREACERRFFDGWLKEQPFFSSPTVVPARRDAVGRLGALSLGRRSG